MGLWGQLLVHWGAKYARKYDVLSGEKKKEEAGARFKSEKLRESEVLTVFAEHNRCASLKPEEATT